MTALADLWAGVATLAEPAIRLGLLERVRRGKEVSARLSERRGLDTTPRPLGQLLWMHAASIGESVSVLPVLQALQARAPRVAVLLTTTTVTSATLLERQLPLLGLHPLVLHRFVPLDVPRWVRRFLDHWRPDAAAFVESELWPNMIAACRARGIPLMLVNARLSPRSAARWRHAPAFARELLGHFARILARSDADAARLVELGAGSVEMAGDLKFAAPPLPVCAPELDRLQELLAGRPRWLAASTHAGEELLIAHVHAEVARRFPGLLTIIVPRHPERGAQLAATLAEGGVRRRSLGEAPPEAGIWLADTLGELGLFYRLCDVVFVGHSLLPPGGGHNPLEPARLGCAVAVGPHTGNFAGATALLDGAGSLTRVPDAAALAGWVAGMVSDPVRRRAAADAGRAVCDRFGDLPARTADALLGLLTGR